jgi:tRNA-2-methylthio-N6-dimethylallyladenosine synthase
LTRGDHPFRAYLIIIEGCDNACSYCVVPYTRGPERSRASDSILREVRELADVGYTELQLLGQTVNSYRDASTRHLTCSELLLAVAEVPGIRRVRFMTSHPRDLGADIVDAIDASPALCDHVHLPVQAGSTRVLRAMQRTYTRDEYLERISLIRRARRPISITTDIIVGFPGETAQDFEETLTLLDLAQFDCAYSFQYSPRPRTPAAVMADPVPEAEKILRLQALQERQRAIQLQRHQSLVGQFFEVLVDGGPRREMQWTGRTSSNHVLNFTSSRTDLLGEYVRVCVTGASPNSLTGQE